MYDLSLRGFSHDDVQKMLRTNRTVTYRYELLDKEDVTIGSVSATGSVDFNADARVKRAASLNIKEAKDVDFLSDRIKPFFCLHTSAGVLDFPLGVFLLSSPSRSAGKGIVSRTIDCYDKLQVLVDDAFDSRWYIPKGSNYIGAINSILESAGITMAAIDACEKESQQDIEFAVGTPKIEAINKLLKAINYTDLYVDAYGVFRASEYVDPQIRAIETTYMTDKRSIVLPGAEEMLDVFNAPNKIVRYLENAEREQMIATAVNTDPASKLSTVSRGRVIVDVEAVFDIADQATLDAYVQRVAAEKKIYQYVKFETAVVPNHEFLDCLYVDNKDLAVSGKYIETAWHLDMEVGGTMSHTARKAVSI